jgi:hypothetical protein
MSAMDTSDGPAAEEKKDDPPPPRFEIKKWNAVSSRRPSIAARSTRRRRTEGRPYAIDATRAIDAKVSRARQRLRAGC